MNKKPSPAPATTLRRLCLALAAAGTLAPVLGHAATVTHQYTGLGGNNWAADFTVVNTGPAASFAGFTVYFAPGTFSNLAIAASPASWDSIVIQPDAALPASGFFDTLALAPAGIPGAGQAQTGFRVTFNWSGATADPGALQFTLNNANFGVVAAGLTSAVPEPASALLAALGLTALVSMRLAQRRQETTNQTQETCA